VRCAHPRLLGAAAACGSKLSFCDSQPLAGLQPRRVCGPGLAIAAAASLPQQPQYEPPHRTAKSQPRHQPVIEPRRIVISVVASFPHPPKLIEHASKSCSMQIIRVAVDLPYGEGKNPVV